MLCCATTWHSRCDCQTDNTQTATILHRLRIAKAVKMLGCTAALYSSGWQDCDQGSLDYDNWNHDK